MPKFNNGDMIRVNYTDSIHFATRQIIGTDRKHGKYVTKFTEDDSVVDSSISIIDSLYKLD